MNREQIVLKLVKMNSSFKVHTFKDGDKTWIGKCASCSAMLTVSLNGYTPHVIEEVVPRYAGGKDTIGNFALVCGGCKPKNVKIIHDEFCDKNVVE